jgi:acyl transferase domain-containing protein
VPRELERWPGGRLKRISINNFGAGGANAHVIVDSGEMYYPPRSTMRNGFSSSVDSLEDAAEPRGSDINSYIFTLSAKDRSSLRASAHALAEHLSWFDSRWTFEDLAYTLNERRSKFPWKISATASNLKELKAVFLKDDLAIVEATSTPRLGFVYTGQGAQWFGMGRELILKYPVFSASLQQAETVIRKLGSSWSLLGI